MNHVFGTGEDSPYDNELEQIECPECLGYKEIFTPYDNESTDGEIEVCPVCAGLGTIDRTDGYTSEDDYEDDEVDNVRDDYYANLDE